MVETRHIVVPVCQLFYRKQVDFTQCEVKIIDPGERAVYTSVVVFPYDFLVIALGSVTNDYGLEGIAQNTCEATPALKQDPQIAAVVFT